jgi:serine/threonine protein kinase
VKRVGHYELQERLGEGGTGDVFRAWDPRLKRTVAIKILHPHQDPKNDERFRREVRLAAALRHPNVLTVYDCSPPESPFCYLVMELVSGGSLRKLVGRKLLCEEAGVLLLPVARALQAAHGAGIVHRDVKPDNILIDRGDPLTVIKLMDFGVALATGEPRITTDGAVSGSIAYMAPEQLASGQITPASDIWSFGVTFFELVSGEHPFGERHVGPLVEQVLTCEPRLPPGHAAPLVELVHGCLQREASRRYPDGAALVSALTRALAESGLSEPDEELQLWARDPDWAPRLQRRLAQTPLPPPPDLDEPSTTDRVQKSSPPVRLLRPWLVPLVAGLLGALVAVAILVRSCLGAR